MHTASEGPLTGAHQRLDFCMFTKLRKEIIVNQDYKIFTVTPPEKVTITYILTQKLFHC